MLELISTLIATTCRIIRALWAKSDRLVLRLVRFLEVELRANAVLLGFGPRLRRGRLGWFQRCLLAPRLPTPSLLRCQ